MASELISVFKGLSRCLLLTILTLLWMILIFYMSSAVEDESRAQSGIICEFLCETFVEGYEQMPPAQQLQMQERFSFPVRKGAHLTEYTILGILLMLTAASYSTPTPCMTSNSDGSPRGYPVESSNGKKRRSDNEKLPGLLRKPALPAFIIGFFYAVSDEIHQYFVPGRAMQARDVLIDTAGVFLGICIVHGINRIRYREQTN